MSDHVPAVLQHNGAAAFDEHLRGVQAVLRGWGVANHVATAGLFHSIYGTEGFQGFSMPLSERATIQALIGNEAEYLCFCFCMVDRYTLDETVFAWNAADTTWSADTANFTLYARPELGRFPIILTANQWLDFLELTVADWLEQVEGAASKANPSYGWQPGQAYAYRRSAYRRMALDVLPAMQQRADRPSAAAAPRMYRAVMATEDAETRPLVQRRTPPQSDAARKAYQALQAAGELALDETEFTLVSQEDASSLSCIS